MKIRNIITSAAIAIVLGLSAGSAFAEYEGNLDAKYGFLASADANYPGTVFVYENDTDVNEGEILSTDGFEQARLPEHILETLRTQ